MGPTDRRLIALHVSPFSERAKWVLDHHRLAYVTIHHAPFLGERRLRKLVVAARGKRATVPVLLAGNEMLTESWDIALYADREGSSSPLIPSGRERQIQEWNRTADETMEAGRLLLVPKLLASAPALDETLPPNLPRWFRPMLRPVTRYGTQWFGRKYGFRPEDAPAYRAKVRTTLEKLRAALPKSSPYLLGEFSYADILMATMLQGVSPVDNRYISLGPATRNAWTHQDLASEFADLIAWRDQLYERHRE